MSEHARQNLGMAAAIVALLFLMSMCGGGGGGSSRWDGCVPVTATGIGC